MIPRRPRNVELSIGNGPYTVRERKISTRTIGVRRHRQRILHVYPHLRRHLRIHPIAPRRHKASYLRSAHLLNNGNNVNTPRLDNVVRASTNGRHNRQSLGSVHQVRTPAWTDLWGRRVANATNGRRGNHHHGRLGLNEQINRAVHREAGITGCLDRLLVNGELTIRHRALIGTVSMKENRRAHAVPNITVRHHRRNTRQPLPVNTNRVGGPRTILKVPRWHTRLHCPKRSQSTPTPTCQVGVNRYHLVNRRESHLPAT